MQLLPRYLVKNRSTIIANEAGFVTEYRPVYSRHLQVYKGIDNVLEFRLLNADQKPVDLSSYTPKFQAFDENKNLVIAHDGEQLTSDGSTPIKGLFKVTITENDILNLKDQYLSYSIHLVDSNNVASITYTNEHFENNATIKISSDAFPGPRDSYIVQEFELVSETPNYWASETITAEPAINGNEALHTAAIYTDSYAGNIKVQATLDNQVGFNNWADVATVTFTGSETEPTPVNFNGVYSYIRFVADTDPAGKVNKILVRN